MHQLINTLAEAPVASKNRSREGSPLMLGIGVTISVVALAAIALRRWLAREPPPIDGGAVSRSWLAEYKLAKRGDSGWQ